MASSTVSSQGRAPAPDVYRHSQQQQEAEQPYESQPMSPRLPVSPRHLSNGHHQPTREPSLNFDGFDGMTPGLSEAQRSQYARSQYSASVSAPRSQRSYTSLADSNVESLETGNTSILPALQTKGATDEDNLEPLQEEELDYGSFDIVAPKQDGYRAYSVEDRAELLMSKEHMGVILNDPRLLGDFRTFLSTSRPASVTLLKYYLDAEKAIRAIKYANSITASLGNVDGHEFAAGPTDDAINTALQAKHDAAFEALTRDELPRFITDVWMAIVSVSMRRKITGSMPTDLRDASEGLAEVFCLSDPSRHDNPIILASDEFHRTTQYGMDYAIGRNCRFLQGPKTNPFSVQRIREKLAAGQEHSETFLNYRRDGSQFMNFLLCAPLFDARGNVRYFLGAQVDVSGLLRECTKLDGLKHLVHVHESDSELVNTSKSSREACQDLSEMFDTHELETVRCHGGTIHQKRDFDEGVKKANWDTPYLVFEDDLTPPAQQSPPTYAIPERPKTSGGEKASVPSPRTNGRLAGVYENYLLVRPAPSLQILFASPSLRMPGMIQSPLLSRIGGTGRVRQQIAEALTNGQGVTAKIRWISGRRSAESDRGRSRWIHCTPMRGVNRSIGIWMVVILDDETPSGRDQQQIPAGEDQYERKSYHESSRMGRRPKMAPPIPTHHERRPATRYSDNSKWHEVNAANAAREQGYI